MIQVLYIDEKGTPISETPASLKMDFDSFCQLRFEVQTQIFGITFLRESRSIQGPSRSHSGSSSAPIRLQLGTSHRGLLRTGFQGSVEPVDFFVLLK